MLSHKVVSVVMEMTIVISGLVESEISEYDEMEMTVFGEISGSSLVFGRNSNLGLGFGREVEKHFEGNKLLSGI
nr:hypothetical protein [Tanacetum cinerariifolium]